MSRRHFAFACDGAQLVGTLDDAPGSTALLLVSGGNEVRAGAWDGQAQLAARIAGAGHPVMRFDRRGVGDSEGANGGFRSSGPDLAAALAALRTEAPQVARVAAFGNCDAASALALHGAALGLDALILANPWVFDGDEADDAPPPAAAVRARYLAKLGRPAELLRLVRGQVDWRKLARGLRAAAAPARPSSLAAEVEAGLARFSGPATILIASRDRTAQAFAAAWPPHDARVDRIDSASHSFSDDAARQWLFERVTAVLRRLG